MLGIGEDPALALGERQRDPNPEPFVHAESP